MTDEEAMEKTRRLAMERAARFGRCAAELAAYLPTQRAAHDHAPDPAARNPFDPAPESGDVFGEGLVGSDGLYAEALNSALAAIVAHEWPGEEAKGGGYVLGPGELLALIEGKAQDPAVERAVMDNGAVLILDQHPAAELPRGPANTIFDVKRPSASRGTRIDIGTLQEGNRQAAKSRHGRGTGILTLAHVTALLALDGHDSLHAIGEQQADRVRNGALRADAAARDTAAAFLDRIGEEEAERRAEAAQPHGDLGYSLEECPVCFHEAFQIDGLAPIWGRVGYGQCVVCSYIRSPDIADEEGFAAHLAWLDS
ncbi:hypothetical protein [Streptomyces rubiginosohelvolus]|uniref:hypothetical protein n=1 Tax=Streptomyces rubiginosohelvolus TaxID=67362 RepID=UPI00371E3B93